MFVRGSVFCINWMNRKFSGDQKFCFAIFIDYSNKVCIHRAPASKNWMKTPADNIFKRLRKLVNSNPKYQQGDFLLKIANGNSYPDNMFLDESYGSGDHVFSSPVLFADGNKGKQFWVKEKPVLLVHDAPDVLKYPDVIIEPGKYIFETAQQNIKD